MAESMISEPSYLSRPFEDVLPDVMAERGIEDLDELYGRYVEAGGKWSKRRFMRHARGEDEFLYPEDFFLPLKEAFSLRDFGVYRAKEGGMWGKGPDWGVYHRLLYSYANHYGERAQA